MCSTAASVIVDVSIAYWLSCNFGCQLYLTVAFKAYLNHGAEQHTAFSTPACCFRGWCTYLLLHRASDISKDTVVDRVHLQHNITALL